MCSDCSGYTIWSSCPFDTALQSQYMLGAVCHVGKQIMEATPLSPAVEDRRRIRPELNLVLLTQRGSC